MADTAPPTFDHADLLANGLSLYVYFAETVSLPLTHGSEDPFFTVKVDGISRGYVAPVGWSFLTSLKAAVLTLTAAVYSGQTITVSLLGTVSDSVANAAALFTDQPVTNSSEVLPVPTGLTGTGGNAQVALSWDTIDPAQDGVRIERSTDGVTFTAIHDKSTAGTTYTDTTASNGTAYAYRIKSFTTSPANESLPSNVFGPVTPIATAEGYYAKHDRMQQRAGVNNLAIYSQLDNDEATEDQDTLQQAMDEADRYVDIRARVLRLTADPAATTPHMIGTANVYFERISDLASDIAVAGIYSARGFSGDASNVVEGAMADMDKKARAELDDILNAVRIGQESTAGTGGIEVIQAGCHRGLC